MRYRFYCVGAPDMNWVDVEWDECKNRDDWQMLWERMYKWLDNSNKQRYGREISDLECPQHIEWLRLNPQPKIIRKIRLPIKNKPIYEETV